LVPTTAQKNHGSRRQNETKIVVENHAPWWQKNDPPLFSWEAERVLLGAKVQHFFEAPKFLWQGHQKW
jgi:hypothetical protein